MTNREVEIAKLWPYLLTWAEVMWNNGGVGKSGGWDSAEEVAASIQGFIKLGAKNLRIYLAEIEAKKKKK